MSVNTWQPEPTTTDFAIDQQPLRQFIELSKQDQLLDLNNQLPAETIATQAPLMTLDKASWQEAVASLSDDDLIHLVRFFTLAEQQLSGWEAQEKSPVIWLVKTLRQRKSPPSKDLLLWIKQHSDNRFLPNGAL